MIFPSGAVTNFKIDIRGRTYEITGPSGNTDKIEFDALDRQIKHVNPDGATLEWIYDCCHLAADADENEVGNTYEYDILGRLIKVADPNGEETKFEYNAEGWQTKIIDPRGEETVFTHDAIGRVIQIDYPGGWQEIMTYWEPGMIKSKKNKKGMDETVVEYEYDELYRLSKKDFPSGTDTELEHYENGLLKKMKDASGEKRYYYDDADRLTKIEQGPVGFAVGTDQNYVLEYVWNAASQLTQMKLTLRTQSMKTWAYTYTDDGYLDVETNPDAEATKHEYLTDGRLKKITVKNNQIGKKETREYFYQDTNDSHSYLSNKNKHLRRTLDKKNDGSTVISEFSYELDKAGIRRSMTDKDEKYNAFLYDPLYQLKTETKWSQKTGGSREYQYAYVFDPNGNRIVEHHDGVMKSFDYGGNNEMLSAGGVDFTYDHFGNTKTKVDGSGTTTYNYDFENHLLNIDFPNTANDDDHEYDGVGRRMRSKLNGASDWTNFVFDELTDNLICEYTLISGTFTIKSLNTWGIGLISTNREGTKRYFHFDGLGSTVALTDFDMNVTDTYVYSAFGITESSSGSSVNPFRFVGQWGYYDDGARGSQSGLLLLGVRYYSPTYGRFWTWDSVRSLALYTYVRNCSVMLTDPSGKFAWIPVLCTAACAACLICIAGAIYVCSDCGADVGCWIDCIAGVIDDMPWWSKALCGLACGGCLACLRGWLLRTQRPAPPPNGIPQFPHRWGFAACVAACDMVNCAGLPYFEWIECHLSCLDWCSLGGRPGSQGLEIPRV